MESSDLELAKRMSAGDAGALAICYDRYASRVFGFLIKLVGSREDAEDLLQVTFLEAWRRTHCFDPSRSRLEAWLYMIARSRALDHLRRRRACVEKCAAEICEPLIPADPSEGLERVESLRRLREALSQLPPDQREALRFAFLAEMTHVQIAEHLNIPLGTIKTRIRLGMMRLREILDER